MMDKTGQTPYGKSAAPEAKLERGMSNIRDELPRNKLQKNTAYRL